MNNSNNNSFNNVFSTKRGDMRHRENIINETPEAAPIGNQSSKANNAAKKLRIAAKKQTNAARAEKIEAERIAMSRINNASRKRENARRAAPDQVAAREQRRAAKEKEAEAKAKEAEAAAEAKAKETERLAAEETERLAAEEKRIAKEKRIANETERFAEETLRLAKEAEAAKAKAKAKAEAKAEAKAKAKGQRDAAKKEEEEAKRAFDIYYSDKKKRFTNNYVLNRLDDEYKEVLKRSVTSDKSLKSTKARLNSFIKIQRIIHEEPLTDNEKKLLEYILKARKENGELNNSEITDSLRLVVNEGVNVEKVVNSLKRNNNYQINTQVKELQDRFNKEPPVLEDSKPCKAQILSNWISELEKEAAVRKKRRANKHGIHPSTPPANAHEEALPVQQNNS